MLMTRCKKLKTPVTIIAGFAPGPNRFILDGQITGVRQTESQLLGFRDKHEADAVYQLQKKKTDERNEGSSEK